MLDSSGISHWWPDAGALPALESVTVADLVDRAVAHRPHGDALAYSAYADLGISVRLSYDGLYEEVVSIADALIDSGLEVGDRVVVWGRNVPQFSLIQWACAYANLVMVPINPLYRRDELTFVLERVDANAVFLNAEDRGASLWDILGDAAKHVSTLRLQVAFEQAPDDRGLGWDQWRAAHANTDRERVLERRRSVKPADLSQIQFTSGTTGSPKGVELTNWILANQGLHMATRAEVVETDRWVNPMPLFHCGGCVVTAMAILAAAATHLPIISFDPKRVCDTIERERATFVSGVTTMLIAMQEEMELNGQSLATLRTVVSGGSVVPPAIGRGWQERLDVNFVITYGQTEFGPLATVTSPQDSKVAQITTCGRPIAHVELDVVTPGTTDRVPVDEEGELRYRGFVMNGYHKDPEATASAVDSEGWLRSGDLGCIDANGYVRITGRAKDMIIRGGENIASASVEDAMRSLDGVADVSVIGVDDDRYGEELCAFVRLNDGATLTAEHVLSELSGRIARFKIPRYLIKLEAFPLTPSGKIQKFRLTSLHATALEEGRVEDTRKPEGAP